MKATQPNAKLAKAKDGEMKTYRVTASSIVRYQMWVTAKSESEAWDYADNNSGEWEEFDSNDWEPDTCEEVE